MATYMVETLMEHQYMGVAWIAHLDVGDEAGVYTNNDWWKESYVAWIELPQVMNRYKRFLGGSESAMQKINLGLCGL
jgi:hypothetical protein